ncbi:MAG: NAD-dependent succinate-semialdehyde dehydrogenase [Hydrogenophaga sp.]|nr:NAD-dependent succinate-semialdehyde dehydrogenase [Hydrogenophaga sp.]MDO9437115.1 NAD-dependent succinate-semialdehyde dehydrogenase [Hydrogenophaga sp.]
MALLIDGDWQTASDGAVRDVIDPATENVIGQLPCATRDDLDRALAAAQRAFTTWKRTPAPQRAKIITDAAALLRQREDTIARTITLELGKPLAESRIEVQRLAGVFEWHAAEAQRLYGRVIPSGTDVQNTVVQEPIGVVAAFTPWNGPAASPGRKISAALAAGCTVVIKPAEETPGTAIAVAQCLQDAGLPAGALNMVFGNPGDISTQLVSSPIVRSVAFTGSVPIGRSLAALAGQHLKPAVLELGGHGPVIVNDDVDVRAVAALCARQKFRNAGQICMSPTRFYVHTSVYDAFAEAFVATTRSLKIGPGFDPASEIGPLANARRRDGVERMIGDACNAGARVLIGGRRLPGAGFYFEPTVLADIPAGADIWRTEPFGPIALLARFRDLDEAIALANDSDYGLAAFAFTRSAAASARILREVDSGIVSVNHFMGAGDSTPFGGVKDSGYGREGGAECFDGYLVRKLASQRPL